MKGKIRLVILFLIGCSESTSTNPSISGDARLNELKVTALFKRNVETDPSTYAAVVNVSDDKLSKYSYLWNFGDDTQSTDRNPIKKYTTFGPKHVSLIVSEISTGKKSEFYFKDHSCPKRFKSDKSTLITT